MATAIVKGMVGKGGIDSSVISATDISEDARISFNNITGVECFDSADNAVCATDVLILAVKPQVAEVAVAGIADKCTDKLIISIAAGITISTLSKWFGTDRIIRVMPNSPLMIGIGASVYACGSDVSERDCEVVKSIFEPIGILRKVPENLMDAVTALSGSGPAYIFEMIQAMADAGVNAGLSERDSLDLTVQTVVGAAEMLKMKIGTPDELRDAVTSPGGTTEAGLSILKQANFRALINDVVEAACTRSAELGK